MNLGFLGKGLGAAAGGYLSGGVLGLKEEQRQREKAQDQELRQAQIDSLNAQRNASQKDPNEGRKKLADHFMQKFLEDDFNPHMQASLRNVRGVKESRDAARKYLGEFYTNKRDWSEFDPTRLKDLAATLDQLRDGPPQPGVPALGTGQPGQPPFGAGEAEAKLAGDPNAMRLAPVAGPGTPQWPMPPDIGSAGPQPQSPMGPFGGVASGWPSAPGGFQKMAGAPLGQPGTTGGPEGKPAASVAAKAPPRSAGKPESAYQMFGRRYRGLAEQGPPKAEEMYDSDTDPVQNGKDHAAAVDRYYKELESARQVWMAIPEAERKRVEAAFAQPKAEADLLRSGSQTRLANTQERQISDPQSIKNQRAAEEAERKRLETESNIARRAAQTAHDGVMASIARTNSATGQRNAATSDRGQQETARHNKEAEKHLKFLEKSPQLSPLLKEELTNWRMKGTNRTSVGGMSFTGMGDTSWESEGRSLMDRVKAELGAGAAATTGGGGGAAGVPQEMQDAINETPEYGSFNTRMKGLKAKNPAAYAAAADAYQKMKGKPYQFPGAGKKKKK